jgi:hypothetical protein
MRAVFAKSRNANVLRKWVMDPKLNEECTTVSVGGIAAQIAVQLSAFAPALPLSAHHQWDVPFLHAPND